MLDAARVNASTVVLLNKDLSPKQKSNKSFILTWELANVLVKPQLQYRIEHCNGLQAASYTTVNSGYSWNQSHKIAVSSRKQKTLTNMLTRNSRKRCKEEK